MKKITRKEYFKFLNQVVTSTPHKWVSGDYITISGHNSPPSVNGTFKIKSVSVDNKSDLATVGIQRL